MKITVLNGSPHGATSVTMQYVHYIQKEFPQEMEPVTQPSRIKGSPAERSSQDRVG